VRRLGGVLLLALLGALAGCQATAVAIIPTSLPTQTQTFTPSPTRTPSLDITPTPFPTRPPQQGLGAPTPLLGAPRPTLAPNAPTPTRPFNPNAPRVEFFTSDPLAVQPGGQVTLFWSVRGTSSAIIYRLDEQGRRSQVYNVATDGNLPIQTRSSERGELAFVLVAGEGDDQVEQSLIVPLRCPLGWFFNPPPQECPLNAAEEQTIIDQTFERGRMVFPRQRGIIYVLFNDGRSPAWLAVEDRYNPAIHAERDENAPPTFIQPLRELGLVWRSDDTIRNRLGLGLAEAVTFSGFVQEAPSGNRLSVYLSGGGGEVLHLLPGGNQWLIIRPP